MDSLPASNGCGVELHHGLTVSGIPAGGSCFDAQGTEMWTEQPTGFQFDAACALDPGRRYYQEDALMADFSAPAGPGWAVLSDGMGGHAAGDVASALVVSKVSSALSEACTQSLDAEMVERLQAAAMAANGAIRAHALTHPETEGMGATLVACTVTDGALYWISIGDSPLFLYREGRLQQLNEDHSLAPQIDFMVKAGLLDAREAQHHPDRNVLTSVLIGSEIPKMDCPSTPTPLQAGDIVIVASDGLQALGDGEIEAVLGQSGDAASRDIADALITRVTSLDDPDLDNVSLCVLKVNAQVGTKPTRARSRKKSTFFDRFRDLVFDRA